MSNFGDITDKVDRFDEAARREKLQSPRMIQMTKAVRFPATIVSDLYIFEVQSATAADGIYNCYKQGTFGVFGPPNIEVLNLHESVIPEDYTPALAAGDKIAAWQTPNDEGIMHWVGFPLTPSVRMFKTTQPPGASQVINCNMVPDGETEVESGLGSDIDVNFKVCGGLVAADKYLNKVSPRFDNNEDLFGVFIGGKCYCVGVAQASENRTCA